VKTALLCHATSEDGYHWERPIYDVVPGTNIVLDHDAHTHGPSVICDSADPDASRRFKLLMRPGNRPEIMGYCSPDGIHWRLVQDEPVIPLDSDCHIGFYREGDAGRYQASFRAACPDRRVWRSESDDFVHWSRPILCLEPDVDDPPQTQIYGLQMTPYGNYVMGWISMYNTREDDLRWAKMAGTMDVQLAHSRNGYGWHRTALGERFIPRGAPGSWEAGLVIPSTAPVILDDELRFYYAATPYGHGGPYGSDIECVGAASLRPDGFIALHAGEAHAELMTRAFAVREPGVFVNADASQGEVRVAVCDGPSGEPLEGFGFDACRPVRGDGFAQKVTWAGDPDETSMARRPIRLRVRAQRADLYAVCLANGGDPTHYWDFREITGRDPMGNLEVD